MTIGNQILREMGSADDASPGQFASPCVSTRDTGPFQAPADLPGAPVAKRSESRQSGLQNLAVRIDVQAEDVNGK